jgi:hypothetical protein
MRALAQLARLLGVLTRNGARMPQVLSRGTAAFDTHQPPGLFCRQERAVRNAALALLLAAVATLCLVVSCGSRRARAQAEPLISPPRPVRPPLAPARCCSSTIDGGIPSSPPPLPPPDGAALVPRGGRAGARRLPAAKGGPPAGAGVTVAALDLRASQDELDRRRQANSGGRPSSSHHLFARVRGDPRSLLDALRGPGEPRLRRPRARPHVRDGGSRVPERNRSSAQAPSEPAPAISPSRIGPCLHLRLTPPGSRSPTTVLRIVARAQVRATAGLADPA